LNAGDTFVANVPGAHLRIVVAGPCAHGNVLYVGVTSDPGDHDHTCLVQPKDHPAIHHDSFIHYGDAVIGSAAALDFAIVGTKQITGTQAVSAEVLRRIIEGFSGSEHARPRYEDFAQGKCSCDKRS
jgi:hypothetical protein